MSSYDHSPWPVKDIVYTAIVGAVMLAAILEWFLWVAAFLYCMVKVYQKAEHWSTKVLAVLVGLVFTLLRLVFLPVMIVTLPLPSEVTQYFPDAMVSFLQWFGFWTFAGLLTVPWLFCVFQLVTHQLGRTKRIKEVLDEHSAPKVVIVMPCYKEEPDILVRSIDSVVDCDYPPSCIHVFLSFDGDQEDELYLNTIERLGVPLSLDTYPKSIDVTYRTARITVSRFAHGGKRHCQKATFKLIDKVYTEYLKRNDNLFILFIDSDCILDRVCLQNFIYDMELSPGNSRDMLAMTGVITATTKKHSLITLLQDMEYIHGQLFERTVESGCGSVTCLPGALTMLRFSAFRRMAKYYFADKAEQCDDLFDYGKCHLGEDRWLTHLFMIGAKKRFQIQMCTSAFCKTEAVQTYRSLIKQRRRWFLGFITNEVCMLTDARIWKRYPILALVRFMQNTIRTTALLFFILLLAIVTTSKRVADLPVGFIAISLGLNWAMMIYFGFKLRRFKTWLYPVMFVVNPFFNWYYMVYGIFTAGQRTWGGPRADAGSADAGTTAQQVIEKAMDTGDELNVVPETFKAGKDSHKSIHLQPPDRLEGRFAAPQRLPGGWYQQGNESTVTVDGIMPNIRPRPTLYQRDSFDSFVSAQSETASVYMPRRVESIMGDDDREAYHVAQSNQRAAGGAYMMAARPADQIGDISDADFQKRHWTQAAEDKRAANPNSITSGKKSPEVASPALTENPNNTISKLSPRPPSVNRFSSRYGSSPLARKSLTQTASSAEPQLPMEMQEQTGGPVESGRGSSATSAPAGRPSEVQASTSATKSGTAGKTPQRPGISRTHQRAHKRPD